MEEGAWRQGGHRAACLDSRASAKVKTMLSLMFVKKHEPRRRNLGSGALKCEKKNYISKCKIFFAQKLPNSSRKLIKNFTFQNFTFQNVKFEMSG